MCRMLGIYTNNSQNLSTLLIPNFLELARKGNIKPGWSEGHTDGWGIAGYLGDKWPTYFGRSSESVLINTPEFISSTQKALNSSSRFIIAHLRKATPGYIPRLTNSHPFISENWIFAHNGAIQNTDTLILPDGINPSGDTDSEKFFLYIKEKIKHSPSSARLPEILKNLLEEISQKLKFTSLTLLISNNEYLIGYRNYRESPEYYTLYFSHNPDEKIALFCSQPIYTQHYKWRLMKNHELIAIRKESGDVKNLP